MIRSIIITVILLFSHNLIVGNDIFAADVKIKRNAAIKIADREAKRLGYNVDSMDMEASLLYTPSSKYLPYENSKSGLVLKNKLKNKVYWVVYYAPRMEGNPEEDDSVTVPAGGDLSIFIDANTKEIIRTFQWK